MKPNFSKRLGRSKGLGFSLNRGLLEENDNGGLSAKSVRQITENFIKAYIK